MMILISSIWTYSNVETSGKITLEVFTALITKNNHDRLFFVISAVRMYMKRNYLPAQHYKSLKFIQF